jgi:hypothetical protein
MLMAASPFGDLWLNRSGYGLFLFGTSSALVNLEHVEDFTPVREKI